MEFLHRGQWQGLAPAPVSHLPGAGRIPWEWPKREMFPGTGGNGTCPRRAPDPCPGERAQSVDHHSTSERFGWLCQEEVAQSDVFTLDWTYPLTVLFSSGWAWNVCFSCSLSLCIQLLNWLISLWCSWWLQREFALIKTLGWGLSFLENPFAGGTSVNTNWKEKCWKKHLMPF